MKIQLRTEVVELPLRRAALRSPSAFLHVYTVDVHLAQAAVFEDYLKQLRKSAERFQAPQRWRSFQVLSGGPATRYLVELPFEKHAEKEAWLHPVQALARALGASEGLRRHREAAVAIERATTSELRFLPDHSARTTARLARYQLLRRTRVRHERRLDYERYLQSLAAAEAAGAGPQATRRVGIRGNLGDYTTTIPFDRATELDDWPDPATTLRRHYGVEDARRLVELELDCTESSEELELCFRLDLSHPRPELLAR